MSNKLSESILQKRIKRFKSIKRGYYSLIAIISLYILSLLSPLWVNDKPLIVHFINGNGIKESNLVILIIIIFGMMMKNLLIQTIMGYMI